MPAVQDTSEIVQALQGLMERLSAPDLTASEANDLRPRLLGLLASMGGAFCPLGDCSVGRVA